MLSRLAVRQDGQNLRGKRSAGLNAENSSPPAKGEVFSLDIPFYRTADQPSLIRSI